MTTTFYKLPAENLDYEVEWDTVIGSATILTSTWTVPAPLIQSLPSITGTKTKVFIAGGVAGSFYEIVNQITTSAGDTFDQSFIVLCAPVTSSSGVSIFNVTRNDIILMALEDIKVYAPDFETPPPAAITRASTRLNMMIKAWQAAGVGLWLNSLYTLPLVVGQTSYLLGPDGNPPIPRPLAVVEARLADSAGNETPMTPMSRDEYMNLPLKTSQGTPNQYYVDAQLGNQVFYIWETASDATDTIKMTVRTPVQDFVNIDDAPDFPIEWSDALHFNLGVRLLSVYDVPDRIAQKVITLAGIALQDADGFDREQNVSIQLAPDMGWGY